MAMFALIIAMKSRIVKKNILKNEHSSRVYSVDILFKEIEMFKDNDH